jgi:hypothetical protein
VHLAGRKTGGGVRHKPRNFFPRADESAQRLAIRLQTLQQTHDLEELKLLRNGVQQALHMFHRGVLD